MPALFINIDVPELKTAVAFYTRAFDLQLGRTLGEGFIELLGAQAPIYLIEKASGTPPFRDANAERGYARHWTPVHLDFVVPEVEVALLRALDAGAKQESEITEHPYGRLVLLSDPFGHGVCLLQLNAKGYDAIASR